MTKKFSRLISILSLISILLIFSALGISAKSDIPTSSYAFGKLSVGGFLPSANKATAVRPQGKDYSSLKLYVGGMPFGIKFLTEGVIVSGFNDEIPTNPARAAGIRQNDVIVSVNGKKVLSAEALNEAIASNGQKTLSLSCTRDGKSYTASLTPAKWDGGYSLGIYVRDSGAGIGTVTFISPENYSFGGLGHGICDSESGRLIPMQRGSVVDVKINGIVKGLVGAPGEVKGYFTSGKSGTLLGNTDCGVYGVFAGLPQSAKGTPKPLGLRNSVRSGKAYVYCMLDGTSVEKYEIEIEQIDRQATSNKCFSVKITDKRLLDKTGGIVQGMSGSPIVQDGKLIGAITHVLINDPTAGYGIFIENMLGMMGDLI